MVYTGRRVAVGLTSDNEPVLLYGVEGRSEASRSRIAIVHGSRVSIEPAGQLTPEQEAMKSRIVYDAIMSNAEKKTAVVSNGRHTGSIFRAYMKEFGGDWPARETDAHWLVSRVLKRWGHEGKQGDRYNTPRIAGLFDRRYGLVPCVLGIVTEQVMSKDYDWWLNTTRALSESGAIRYITTYTGETEEPQAPVFQSASEITKTQHIEGKTAQELAEEMYTFMDPNVVVCAAVALWVSTPVEGSYPKGKWELAVKNKS